MESLKNIGKKVVKTMGIGVLSATAVIGSANSAEASKKAEAEAEAKRTVAALKLKQAKEKTDPLIAKAEVALEEAKGDVKIAKAGTADEEQAKRDKKPEIGVSKNAKITNTSRLEREYDEQGNLVKEAREESKNSAKNRRQEIEAANPPEVVAYPGVVGGVYGAPRAREWRREPPLHRPSPTGRSGFWDSEGRWHE